MDKYLVAALAACATAAGAQEIPNNDDLMNRVDLPGYWEVEDFRIIAQSSVGTPIAPRVQLRFEIDASPETSLFVSAGSENLGPFVTVIESAGNDTLRTIYGTMDISYSAGEWSGPVNVENPVDGLGRPRDSFLKPTLILGSDRQTEVAEALRSKTATEVRIALERDRSRLLEEHAAAIESLKALHLQEMSELRLSLEEDRVRLSEEEAALKEKLAGIDAQLQARFDAGKVSVENKLDHLRTELQGEFEDLRAAHEVRVRELKETQVAEIGSAVSSHLEELLALETEHERAMGELIAEQEREMAELSSKLATRKESLQTQIDMADEVLSLQAALTARQTAIRVNDEAIRAAEAQRQEEFGKSLDALIGTWTGTGVCDIGNGHQTFNFAFSWAEVVGRSLSGIIQNKSISGSYGREVAASLHLTGNDLTLPLSLKLVTNSLYGLGTQNLDLELGADGWMIGKSQDDTCTEVRVSKS